MPFYSLTVYTKVYLCFRQRSFFMAQAHASAKNQIIRQKKWSALHIFASSQTISSFTSDTVAKHFDTSSVSTIKKAADILHTKHYDLIFLELKSSSSRGIDKLQQITRLAPEHPIVVITSLKEHKTLAQFLHYGAQDHIHIEDIKDKLLPRIAHYAIERKATEFQLAKLARYDALTGLVNRTVFMDRLERALSISRDGEGLLAVLLLDLDEFKNVNDTLGHSVGDELLKQVAERIGHCVRASDTIARLGGDEFTVLLENVQSAEAILMICQKINTELNKTFQINGHEIFSSASIGISTTSLRGTGAPSPEKLIKHADIAMYRAKQEGGNRCIFFTRELQMAASIRSTLEMALRKAVEHEEFSVVYQPQFNADNHTLYGAEALLRWRHPSYGDLAPTTFIPALEASGLIYPVTEWLISKTLEDWAYLIEQGKIDKQANLSINLSPKLLRKPSFINTAIDIAQKLKIDPQCIYFELTENLFVDANQHTLKALNQIKEAGFMLAMDDFGTGYSSLSYLKHFPLDCIKLDRTFIKDILCSKIDAAIAEAAINLARKIDICIIAEGVDEERKLATVRQYGCHIIQGQLFSPPLSRADFAHYSENLSENKHVET